MTNFNPWTSHAPKTSVELEGIQVQYHNVQEPKNQPYPETGVRDGLRVARVIDSREFAFPFSDLRFCPSLGQSLVQVSHCCDFLPSFFPSVRKCQLSFFPFRPFLLSFFLSFPLSPFLPRDAFRIASLVVVWKPHLTYECNLILQTRKHCRVL